MQKKLIEELKRDPVHPLHPLFCWTDLEKLALILSNAASEL